MITDHRALVWLFSFKEPDGLVARWIEKLGLFDFEIKHRPGTQISHADALSRTIDNSYKISAVNLESSTEAEVPFAKAQADEYTLGKFCKWLISQNRPRDRLYGGISCRKAGAVLYVHKCAKVAVHIADFPYCTEEVPGIMDNSTKIKYMNPITQVVYTNYTLTSCDPIAPYMYKTAEGIWMHYGSDHSVARNPESLSVFSH